MAFRVALLASDGLRDGPDSDLMCFIRRFEPFLEQQDICVSELTLKALKECGLLRNAQIDCVPAEWDGGLVEITYKVVSGELDVVIFFMDPRDPASLYPETAALKRECVAQQVLFLSTYASAAEWATLEWAQSHSNFVLNPQDAQNLMQSHIPGEPLENQSIALIAHDAKKMDMVKFVNDHLNLLAKFQHIWATGTTGWLLRQLFGTKKQRRNWVNELKRKPPNERERIAPYQWFVEVVRSRSPEAEKEKAMRALQPEAQEQLKKLLDEFKKHFGSWTQQPQGLTHKSEEFADKVKPLKSGPKGGDAEVAQRVLGVNDPNPATQKCHKVIFFEDPFNPQPHEPDIRLLERVCRLPGTPEHPEKSISKKVVCISDPKSAHKWAEAWEDIRRKYQRSIPITLAEALEKYFEIHVILSSEQGMDHVLCAAARYFHSLIVRMGKDKASQGNELRVVVPAGPIMQHLVRKLEQARSEAGDEERASNLVTLPMMGMLELRDPSQEANVLAERIADLYGGRSEHLPISAFIRQGVKKGKNVEKVLNQYKEADVALLLPQPLPLQSQGWKKPWSKWKSKLSGTEVDVGGMLVGGACQVVVPHGYEWVGVEDTDLDAIVTHHDRRILLISWSKDPRHVDAVDFVLKGRLKGHLASRLVADVDSARALLRL